MRLRLLTTLTLITTLVSISTVLQSRRTANAIAVASQNSPQVKRKPIQPDLPGTVSGAINPEAIPDIGTTQSVPSGTGATLEANEVNSGGISYSVNPPSRNISFLLQGGGNTDTRMFTFLVEAQQSPQSGKIDTTVFLGVQGITAGAPRNVDVSLTVPPSWPP